MENAAHRRERRADLYLLNGSIPQTTANYAYKSDCVGADGTMLRSDQYNVGQDWYLLVNATADAQWSIFTGRAWVQDLGTLAWTDRNANSQYDIGESALSSGSGNVNLGPEGIGFFKTIVPTGTPAWSLWLNGDPRDLAVRKNFVPFHTSATYYDLKLSVQMLVVPTHLGTGAATYSASVTGNPGDAVNLASRKVAAWSPLKPRPQASASPSLPEKWTPASWMKCCVGCGWNRRPGAAR